MHPTFVGTTADVVSRTHDGEEPGAFRAYSTFHPRFSLDTRRDTQDTQSVTEPRDMHPSAPQLSSHGDVSTLQRDPFRSARDARERLRRCPTDTDAMMQLAEALARLEHHAEAHDTWRALLRADGRFADLQAPTEGPAATGFIGGFDPVSCPICGEDDHTPVWVGNISQQVRTWGHLDPVRTWVRCAACETVRVLAPPSAPALERWAEQHQAQGAAPVPPNLQEVDRALRLLQPELDALAQFGFGDAWLDTEDPRPRLLEVGSDWGVFLAAAAGRDFAVTGATDAPRATWAMGRLGVPCVVTQAPLPFTDADIPDGVFDMIVVRPSLDTAPDPVSILATIARRLSPQGIATLQLALQDHPVHRLSGYDSPQWSHPASRTFFHRATLEVALARAGLRSIAWRTPAMGPPGQSLVYVRHDDLHEVMTSE